MAPAIFNSLTSRGAPDGPLAEAARLLQRDSKSDSNGPDPSSGVLDPHDINNVGFFVLFALLGLAFVVTGIWFFFWAKNGGFHFKEKDWDDYKTTVLRRRGPNGTLLSGATESTNLGGGSVYKDVADDDGMTEVTGTTGLSGVTAGASDIGAREKRKEKQAKRDRERERKRAEKSREKASSSGAGGRDREARRHVGTDGVEDEHAEKAAKKELRSYRHERPARVGGLNKISEGSNWDGSTNPSASEVTATEAQELLPGQDKTPPAKKSGGGIRKVYSSNDRTAERDQERIRAEARRLRDEGRAARRDFSYQRAGAAESAVSESLLSGGSGEGSDLGTKTYQHSRPETREQRQREREERRARRGGYRRGQGDEI